MTTGIKRAYAKRVMALHGVLVHHKLQCYNKRASLTAIIMIDIYVRQ